MGARFRSHAVARPLPRVYSVIATLHTPPCRVFSVKHEGTSFYPEATLLGRAVTDGGEPKEIQSEDGFPIRGHSSYRVIIE